MFGQVDFCWFAPQLELAFITAEQMGVGYNNRKTNG
jgi:hypothetical protein